MAVRKENDDMSNVLTPGRHDVTINGARLVYHVHGEGPLVVALPGGPGFSHTYLRAPLLEEKAKVVYFDPLGCGDSARLDDPTTYGRSRDVADLEELRRHLGIDRLALLGHSSGGFLAQEYALERPARVDRMILVDTSPTNGPEFGASLDRELKARSTKAWFPAADAALKGMFTRQLTDDEARALANDLWPLYAYDHDANPSLAARLSEIAHFNVVRFQKAPPVRFDFRGRLRSLENPTLIVVGARDFICAPALAKSLHASIPGSKLVVMEQSGHMPHLEEPALFAGTVASFLNGPR
jgi:proline iminopeptidase